MSNLLQTLVVDAETVVGPVLASLSQTPTVQLIEKYTLDVVLAVEFKQTSFPVGAYTVTAKLNGTPAAFSIGAAFQALENIEAGKLGSFTSGALEIDVQSTATAGTVATSV